MPKDGYRSVRGLFLAVTLVASSAATARAEEIGTIKQKTLKVCLYAGFAPFAFKQGKEWKGWDVTFLQNFAAANTLDFEPVEQPIFDNIWLLPGQGVCDIAATGISDTADRRKATNVRGKVGCWSATYYGVLRTFLVRTVDYARLEDVRDLAGKTAVVTKGSTANTDLCYRMKLANLHPWCVVKQVSSGCMRRSLRAARVQRVRVPPR